MKRLIWNITKRLLVIIPIIILFLYMYEQLIVLERNNARERVVSEHTGHLNLMDFFINEIFSEYYITLHLIRNSDTMRNYLADPSDENKQEVEAFFRRMVQNRSYINGLLLGSSEGDPLVGLTAFDDNIEDVGSTIPFAPIWGLLVSQVKNVEEDEFYFTPLSYIIPPTEDKSLYPAVGTSIPIYRNGERVAIIGMLVDGNHILSWIAQFIKEQPSEIEFSLFDNYGNQVLTNTPEGLVHYSSMTPTLPQSRPLIWEQIVKEGKGMTVIDGYNYYYHAFDPFKDVNPFYDTQPHFLVGVIFFADQDITILSDSFLLRRKSLRWVLALFIFVVVGFINILTYFRQSDRELLEVGNMISDQSHDGVVVIDPHTDVTYSNHTFQSMTGYTDKEIKAGRHRVISLSGEAFDAIKSIESTRVENSGTASWRGFLWLVGKRHVVLTHLKISAIVNTRGRILHKVGLYSYPRNPSQESFEKMILVNGSDTVEIDQYPLQLLNQKCDARVDHPFMVVYVKLVNLDVIEVQYTLDEHYLLGAQIRERIAQVLEDDDLIIQFSPDTFLVTIPVTSFSDSEDAGRMLKVFDEPLEVSGQSQSIRTRCGISSSSADCSDVSLLLRQARMALVAQNHFGRNGSLVYDETINEHLLRYYEILQSFPKALESGEIVIYFQPVVDTITDTIIGAEALARWTHPKLGPIPPNEFIPIVEQNNLERLLGRYVVEQVVQLLHNLSSNTKKQFLVSMNLCPTELQDLDLVPHMVRTLDAYNVPHELLIIELTERSLLTDLEVANKKLKELHQERIKIAIDDFGTGFSSLSYLHELDIDKLKIDRSFIKNYPESDDAVILKAMVRMAKELGIAVVMEGVELPEQLALLKELEVTYYQGFIFSKAVTKEEFISLVNK